VLALGLAANLLVLLHFKLADFTCRAGGVGRARGAGRPHRRATVLAPLGLSYYTLQAIAYLVAVYQGRLAPAPGWVALPLYLAYFPKFIAGPLELPGPFLAQLAAPRVVDNAAVARGVGLILLGLFRKLVLAELLFAYIPDLAFHRAFFYGRLGSGLALAAYAFALSTTLPATRIWRRV
jgi:D-alanyl-lipoteichoic acid acyltransferase DltB (MBOAT superfamily)